MSDNSVGDLSMDSDSSEEEVCPATTRRPPPRFATPGRARPGVADRLTDQLTSRSRLWRQLRGCLAARVGLADDFLPHLCVFGGHHLHSRQAPPIQEEGRCKKSSGRIREGTCARVCGRKGRGGYGAGPARPSKRTPSRHHGNPYAATVQTCTITAVLPATSTIGNVGDVLSCWTRRRTDQFHPPGLRTDPPGEDEV
jgi:hypothetical protein